MRSQISDKPDHLPIILSSSIEDEAFKTLDLHVHVPAGSIPKDRPSAGVTMLAALVSLLTGIKVRADVAMTGEITLRGKVLPVGGIKEKVLAARRAGVKRVVMPERNRKDLIEIPEENKEGLEFFFAQTMDDVLVNALHSMPKPLDPNRKKKPSGGEEVGPAPVN